MQPKIYHVSDHDIDPKAIDADALYVLEHLRNAGYNAYLVGGSVRDLIMKRKPKDFDISTSARPEEIKRLFGRRCILIGRRFRLAHIRFSSKVFEVSTFRAGENDGDLILQDNKWGTPEEDVLRRDFTINGLFYDAVDHTIIDYVGGWDDIHATLLRTIGEPVVRFKQDPVRMLRLLKFQARYKLKVDPKSWDALLFCREHIIKSAPARILEEILRMLELGSSEPFFRLMAKTGFLELLFPCLQEFINTPHGEKIYKLLTCADRHNLSRPDKPLDRSILTSCLVYPILEHEIATQYPDKKQTPHINDILLLSGAVVKGVVTSSFSHFPRRISTAVGFILVTQYRLTPLVNTKVHRPRLFSLKEFPLALQFFKLRAIMDHSLVDSYNHWKNSFLQHLHQHDKRHHHHHGSKNTGAGQTRHSSHHVGRH